MKWMMITLFTLFTVSSFAATDKLSPKDVMLKVDNNKIAFEVEPAIRRMVVAQLMSIGKIDDPRNIPENLILSAEQGIIKQFRAQYLYFQPEMGNVRYFQDSSWRYSITFDFATTKKCTLRVEKLDPNCGNPLCSANVDPATSPNVDINGTIIPDSYCEKIYGIKITPQGSTDTGAK